MKQLSTGTGLAVLGLSILGCMILANGNWSTSFAAPAQHAEQERQTQPPSKMSSSVCGIEQWFDPTLRSFASTCGNAAFVPTNLADVNRDGLVEIFSCPEVIVAAGTKTTLTGFASNDLISRAVVQITPEGPVTKQVAVFPIDASFGNSLIAQLPQWDDTCECCRSCCPSSVSIGAQVIGWADCDGDGDLDAVLHVKATHRIEIMPCIGGGYTEVLIDRTVWCKNIGFQSQLFGDLDNDGHVGAADLSIMLLNFTD